VIVKAVVPRVSVITPADVLMILPLGSVTVPASGERTVPLGVVIVDVVVRMPVQWAFRSMPEVSAAWIERGSVSSGQMSGLLEYMIVPLKG